MCDVCGCPATIHSHASTYALNNKQYFSERKILALNIMSSPGAGKTTLLTKTIAALKNRLDISVVAGDQHTDHDAAQIQLSGAPVIQVNTGKVCHLDAHMLGHAVEKLSLQKKSTLFIENVSNLVCPARFDLGETYKIVVLSVTEGENKPLKYPDIFRGADLMILTKTDLLPYVSFDVDHCLSYARQIKPDLEMIALSSTQESGLENWYQWLHAKQL